MLSTSKPCLTRLKYSLPTPRAVLFLLTLHRLACSPKKKGSEKPWSSIQITTNNNLKREQTHSCHIRSLTRVLGSSKYLPSSSTMVSPGLTSSSAFCGRETRSSTPKRGEERPRGNKEDHRLVHALQPWLRVMTRKTASRSYPLNLSLRLRPPDTK